MKTLNQFLTERTFTFIGKKKSEKKAEKAMDAGAKARRLMKRREHAKYVSGSEDNVPDDIREGDVHSGQGEKIQSRTLAWMKKRGEKGAPGLDAMKARTAEHKAKRGVKEEVIDESEKVASGAQKRSQELGAKRRQASYKKYGANVGSPGKNERAGYNLARKARSAESSPETQVTKKKKPSGFDTGQQGHARKRDEKTSVGKSGKTLKTPKYKLSFKDRQTHHTRTAYSRRDPQQNPKHTAHKSVKEDKAFDYVVAKLKAKHGDGVLTKGDKIKPPSAAQKKKNAAIMAQRAKQDGRDATEKASSGRYNDRSRSD